MKGIPFENWQKCAPRTLKSAILSCCSARCAHPPHVLMCSWLWSLFPSGALFGYIGVFFCILVFGFIFRQKILSQCQIQHSFEGCRLKVVNVKMLNDLRWDHGAWKYGRVSSKYYQPNVGMPKTQHYVSRSYSLKPPNDWLRCIVFFWVYVCYCWLGFIWGH